MMAGVLLYILLHQHVPRGCFSPPSDPDTILCRSVPINRTVDIGQFRRRGWYLDLNPDRSPCGQTFDVWVETIGGQDTGRVALLPQDFSSLLVHHRVYP